MVSQTARWLSVVAAGVGYLLLWLGWRQGWGWLTTVDTSALNAAYDIGVKHHGWVVFWRDLCAVCSPAAFRLVGVVAVVAAVVRRKVWTAVFLLVTVELCGLLTQGAKGLAERPRPVTALVAEPSWSFPSGHALGVLVSVAALLTVLPATLNRRARVAAVAVGALIVVAVGAGRVALNVHHPSDVLAGWLLGYLYFLLCRRLVPPTRT